MPAASVSVVCPAGGRSHRTPSPIQGCDRLIRPLTQQLADVGKHARAQRLLAAANEAREAACVLHDADALIFATSMQYRAREILRITASADRYPLDPRCPSTRQRPAGLLDQVELDYADRRR
jgi:hypothetical protein